MENLELAQKGYYRLKFNEVLDDGSISERSKMLHFSMVAWMELQQDTGKDIRIFGAEYEELDDLGKFKLLCEVAFAAAKAYDLEKGNEIDYNIHNMVNWMGYVEPADAIEFQTAMTASLKQPLSAKK